MAAVSHIRYETYTDSNGFYQFAFLPPGVYSLFETQPESYDDGQESLGSLGGIIGQDSFSQIVLNAGDFMDYNFGELRREPEYITGDSNHDGIFNLTDLLVVFQAGEYEDGVMNNSTFEEGDWNGDGDFTSSDLVLALQAGTFVPTALDDDE
ncbi:MAG: carboxypeptidase-like regulatory domain-containing protein [Pirellulaceae bacterium]